jgi:hypothetical protein
MSQTREMPVMLEGLRKESFDIAFEAHAEAILSVDFPEVAAEIEDALLDFRIPVRELVAGGGGEAQGTQRLRRSLAAKGWSKQTFVVERSINGVRRESQSHEVDHVREYADGKRIALEIEWNNKDPFFDRDLENFKRLHADGAISVGIIITRGAALHNGLKGVIGQFLSRERVADYAALAALGSRPTDRQREMIRRRMENANLTEDFAAAVVQVLVSDKFGEATTHWRKLEDRRQRGVGNPCPLLLLGLPLGAVSFD